jgi:hypothetical protein
MKTFFLIPFFFVLFTVSYPAQKAERDLIQTSTQMIKSIDSTLTNIEELINNLDTNKNEK